MKRKIDDMDTVPSKNAPSSTVEEEFSFTDLGLDPRLVQAVAEQKFLKPTLVQRKAIPLALKGQDVLCKAKTGSGKTAAYVLPVLASILKRKMVCLLPVCLDKREVWELTKFMSIGRPRACYVCSHSGTNPRTGRPSFQVD
jgi:superfamily II DNA/RNA helicase